MEKPKGILKKWFRRDNLIVLVLLGVLLFVVALPTSKPAKNGMAGASGTDWFGRSDDASHDKAVGTETENGDGKTENGDAKGLSQQAVFDYAKEQEERLEKILSSVEGVGKVRVMLTIEVSEELVVEKDSTGSHSNTDERDSAGGNRVSVQSSTDVSTVYSMADGDSRPYVVKVLSPRVEGVLVVAEGGGNGTVNRYITQIVQALFGVEAHRVRVVPMG